MELTRELPVDVRFIELMPIGEGKAFQGRDKEELLAVIRKVYPDLKRRRKNGETDRRSTEKCRALRAMVGFIEALHGKFCSSCNRLRLTSEGFLKPCLYYRRGVDLKALLRGGAGKKNWRRLFARPFFRNRRRIIFRRGIRKERQKKHSWQG